MRDDLKPLPVWRQRWNASASRRRKALIAFKAMVGTLVSLAIAVLGATLIAYGVWAVYPPAGFTVAGVLVWVLQWSHEKDKEGDR